MHDPMTMICSFPSYDQQKWMEKKWWIPKRIARLEIFTLWHKDPCKTKGRMIRSDDSCGWFMRAGHGDPKVLEKIEKRFEFDWDRVFQPDGTNKIYHCGLFRLDGQPNFSVYGVVLNLFFIASSVYFECDGSTNWNKSRRWMRKNLYDILMFAENPTDSLFDGITRKFEIGCNEKYTECQRKERIHSMASCIYGYILRNQQKWWQHPRWHIHHWRFQIRIWQQFKRRFIEKCCVCGKGFKSKESVISNWDGDKIWHDRCDKNLRPQ